MNIRVDLYRRGRLGQISENYVKYMKLLFGKPAGHIRKLRKPIKSSKRKYIPLECLSSPYLQVPTEFK